MSHDAARGVCIAVLELAARRLTLGDLWERYRTTCATHLACSSRIRADTAGRAAILIAHFGAKCDVRGLTVDDVVAFRNARRAGGIRVNEKWTTKPVRVRSVVGDLAVLKGMLNWARTTRVNGVRLLDADPIAGVRTPRDRRPRRPISTWDRFVADPTHKPITSQTVEFVVPPPKAQ